MSSTQPPRVMQSWCPMQLKITFSLHADSLLRIAMNAGRRTTKYASGRLATTSGYDLKVSAVALLASFRPNMGWLVCSDSELGVRVKWGTFPMARGGLVAPEWT